MGSVSEESMTKRTLSLIACAGVLSLFTLAAHAGPILYALDYPQSATLYTVDQSTGTMTVVGPVGLDNVGDLTSDQISKLYGIQITTNSLVTIDPTTGLGTLGPAITGTALNDAGAPLPIVSLAFNPFTGVLYGNTSVGFGGATQDQLYSIDTSTGVATPIGTSISENAVYALAFGQDSILYGVDGSNNLDQISTTTGIGIVVAPTGLTSVFDIASRPGDGTMFAASSGTTSIYTLDLGTGTSTLVGPNGFSTNVVGLAFLDAPVPEPSSIALLATGLVFLGFAVHRRRRTTLSR
jgi:hypothetical protein